MKDSRGERSPFGELLRSHRRAAGMTQDMLAERAGYSTVYVSMLERGERQPQTPTVQHLSSALSLSALDRAGLLAALEDTASGLVGREAELGLIDRHLSGMGRLSCCLQASRVWARADCCEKQGAWP
jgi:transcriptional regulator with XRE-family HTH domain